MPIPVFARGIYHGGMTHETAARPANAARPSARNSARLTRANNPNAHANRENLAAVGPQSIQARNYVDATQNAPYAQTSCKKKSPHPNGCGPGGSRGKRRRDKRHVHRRHGIFGGGPLVYPYRRAATFTRQNRARRA